MSKADLFSLPTRLGGMGIRDPIKLMDKCFNASLGGSSIVVEYLMGKERAFFSGRSL